MDGTACLGGYLPNIMTGASAAANLAAIGFTSTASGMVNLKLLYNSPYISGGSGEVSTMVPTSGSNMNALLTAQGAVGTPTVRNISASTATVSWFVYDGTVACAVELCGGAERSIDANRGWAQDGIDGSIAVGVVDWIVGRNAIQLPRVVSGKSAYGRVYDSLTEITGTSTRGVF